MNQESANQNFKADDKIGQPDFYELDPTFIQAIIQLKLRQSLNSQNQNPDVIRIGLAEMNFQDLLRAKYYDEAFINQFFSGKVDPWSLSPSDFNDSNKKLTIWQQNISLIKRTQIPKMKFCIDALTPKNEFSKSLLHSILHIEFSSLKALHITSEKSDNFTNLQFLNWIEMPNLQALHIETDNVESLRSLCKTNFKKLRELKITMRNDEKFTALCKDLPSYINRIRTLKGTSSSEETKDELPKTLYFFPLKNQNKLYPANMFIVDLRMADMSSISKMESPTVHISLLDSPIYNNQIHEAIRRKNSKNVIQYSKKIFNQMNRIRMQNDQDTNNYQDHNQLQNRWNMFRNLRNDRADRFLIYRQFEQDIFPIIGDYNIERQRLTQMWR